MFRIPHPTQRLSAGVGCFCRPFRVGSCAVGIPQTKISKVDTFKLSSDLISVVYRLQLTHLFLVCLFSYSFLYLSIYSFTKLSTQFCTGFFVTCGITFYLDPSVSFYFLVPFVSLCATCLICPTDLICPTCLICLTCFICSTYFTHLSHLSDLFHLSAYLVHLFSLFCLSVV